MVVLISFRKKTFKINYILVVIILLVSFNLYFIKVLDSNLTQNYTNSIPNTGSIVDRTSEEFENELQTEIVSWGEILTDNSNLFSLDNIISYPDDALVKVRNDNKMEFVVKRDALEFSQEINEFLSKYDVEIHKDVPYFNASIIYTPVENLDEFISESESVFGISYIEPNFYVQLDFIPDDEYYESDQWDLPLIGMESAWEYGFGSHNVLVALVDTGIDYTHPDLSENYIPLGYDWVNNDSDPMDDYFHGTHCAGTIAAVIDNEIGIAGMANVSIFAEKAFNSYGQGSNVDCGLAIKHAVDMGADIISCSWGGSQSQILQESIEYALNNDVMVIAAAGNSNNNIPHYPAAYSDVIAVSATNQDDNKASFSSFGDWVDVSAPGVDILSTVPYSFMGSYYFLASGTSMATPHVSGFAALLMSSFSDFNCSQIENLIYESVVDLGDPGFDPYFGHGRIDVSFILGPDITPPKCLNLIESANPLELGDTEIITADISDRSGVNQVVIQFEGSNHSMIHTGGNTWQYNSWTPLSTGVFNYKIFMEDVYNNWGSIIRSIQVKVDATPPSYKNLIESADPLELGNSEIISIEVSDLSGVNQVVIQFEGSNHSMIYTGGNTWQYDSWIPLGIGIYPYIIYMVDNHNNWGSVTGSIQVKEDATPPSYLDIYESADPLKLGNTEIIAIEVFDSSGINQVLIQYEESNHSMIKISGNWWQYYSWVPSNVGNYIYTIFMEDNYDNWESVSGSIEVIEGGPDLIPPTYSNLTESADPLELGNSEIISIEVSDFSGVNQVIIQFEGSNHSMIHTEGNTWQYDSWTPSSIGVYPYIIYMEDNHNNWGSTTGSIQVKEDATPPSYSNLYESADPLELGKTEVISIEVFDLSGVNQVMIQFEGSNHSMMHIGSNIWQYDSWTPSSIGIYSYIIFMVDNYNNCRLISESIQVKEDVTPPTYSNINESADPLERGNTEIISIEASDLSGVNQVMIQFEGSNHSMINIGGNIWQYDSWIPLNMDINLYTIYMVDNYNNWESVSGSIQVIDTTPPSYSDLYESADPLELGNTELLSIVVSDLSGVKQVIIHFEEFDHPMTYRGINIWEYDSWTPSGIGIYPYTIYMMDNYDNWESVSGSIQVIDATPPSYSDLYESADPLELGNSEIISIEVSDFSGVNQVIIQFEG
ncbi:MAG: S8 family peptidase, partial [Candidatus Hermodarchaeota archaeon]